MIGLFGSSQLFDLEGDDPGFAARETMTPPYQVDVGHLFLALPLAETRVLVRVLAGGYPTDHLSPLLHGPLLAERVGAQKMTQMTKVLAAGLLGLGEAMEGMVFLFLCNMREVHGKYGYRLRCHRLLRRKEESVGGSYTARWSA